MGFASKLSRAGASFVEGFGGGFVQGQQNKTQQQQFDRTSTRLEEDQKSRIRSQRLIEATKAMETAPIGQRDAIIAQYPDLAAELRSQQQAGLTALNSDFNRVNELTSEEPQFVPLTTSGDVNTTSQNRVGGELAELQKTRERLRGDTQGILDAGGQLSAEQTQAFTALNERIDAFQTRQRQLQTNISMIDLMRGPKTYEDTLELEDLFRFNLEAAGIDAAATDRMWGSYAATAKHQRVEQLMAIAKDPGTMSAEAVAAMAHTIASPAADLAMGSVHMRDSLLMDEKFGKQLQSMLNSQEVAITAANLGDASPMNQLIVQLRTFGGQPDTGTAGATALQQAEFLEAALPAMTTGVLTKVEMDRAYQRSEQRIIETFAEQTAIGNVGPHALTQALELLRSGRSYQLGEQTLSGLKVQNWTREFTITVGAQEKEAGKRRVAETFIRNATGGLAPDDLAALRIELDALELPASVRRALGLKISEEERTSLQPQVRPSVSTFLRRRQG